MMVRIEMVLVFILAGLLANPGRLMAQVPEIDAPCNARLLVRFHSPGDSIQCLHYYRSLLRLDSAYAVTQNPLYVQESMQTATEYLAFADSVLEHRPHPALIWAYEAVGTICRRYDLSYSIECTRKSIDLLDSLFHCDTYLGNSCRRDLAFSYLQLQDVGTAISVGEDNLARILSMPLIDSVVYADQHMLLGQAYRQLYEYKRACEHFRKVDAIHHMRSDSISVQANLWNLANAYQAVGDFVAAEEVLKNNVLLAEKLYPPLSNATIAALDDLVAFYQSTAQIHKANRVVQEAITRLDAPATDRNPTYYTYRPAAGVRPETEYSLWLNAALIAMDIGQPQDISQCNDRALEAARRIEDPQTRWSSLSTALFSMASNDIQRFRYESALRYLEQARTVQDSMPDRTEAALHTQYERVLRAQVLSRGYGAMHEADSMLAVAVSGLEALLGVEHPIVGTTCALAGEVRGHCKHFEEARGLIRRAQGIYGTAPEGNRMMLARCAQILAGIELEAGRIDSATVHARAAMEAFAQLLDIRHRNFLNTLHTMARIMEHQPDCAEAPDIMRHLTRATVARVRDAFSFEGEEQQVRIHHYVGMRHLSTIARWARQPEAGDEAAKILLDAVIALKGVVLSESIRLNRVLHNRRKEQRLSDTLMQLRERFAMLATRDVDESHADDAAVLRSQYRHAIDSLDTHLRRVSAVYQRDREIQNAEWRTLQRCLQPGEAVVEYLAFENAPDSADRSYLAIVLRPDSAPQLVNLCQESEIERATMLRIDESTVSLMPEPERMHTMYELVFQPLLPLLDHSQTVFIVPDGVLHRLAFCALVTGTDRDSVQLLDDRFILRHLACSRDLITSRRGFHIPRRATSQRFLLIGNPAFTSEGHAEGHSSMRGWQELPGTAREIDDLVRVCSERGVQADRLEGKAASERAIKDLSGHSPRVLHLATHGYFYPVRTPVNTEHASTLPYRYARGGSDVTQYMHGKAERAGCRGQAAIAGEGHPLLRSGLILAGANAVWTGMPVAAKANDGILTAMEVSQLDLENTELVVLSACETALGDIRTGEGVFGLQRAFIAAGASSMIMSLWKVSDNATAEFMHHFYTSWLAGTSKQEAMRNARLTLREQYPDPRLWAAFVLVGD